MYAAIHFCFLIRKLISLLYKYLFWFLKPIILSYSMLLVSRLHNQNGHCKLRSLIIFFHCYHKVEIINPHQVLHLNYLRSYTLLNVKLQIDGLIFVRELGVLDVLIKSSCDLVWDAWLSCPIYFFLLLHTQVLYLPCFSILCSNISPSAKCPSGSSYIHCMSMPTWS